MKLLNFENWSSGELSKIGHHFRKYSGFKIDVIKKNVNNKRYAPKFIFFKKKAARFGGFLT